MSITENRIAYLTTTNSIKWKIIHSIKVLQRKDWFFTKFVSLIGHAHSCFTNLTYSRVMNTICLKGNSFIRLGSLHFNIHSFVNDDINEYSRLLRFSHFLFDHFGWMNMKSSLIIDQLEWLIFFLLFLRLLLRSFVSYLRHSSQNINRTMIN